MTSVFVEKRDGRVCDYDSSKVYSAISKAAGAAQVKIPQSKLEQVVLDVTETVCKDKKVKVSDIESVVFDTLCQQGYKSVARCYEGYRAIQEYKRKVNTSDKAILGLVRGTDQELIDDNSNKNAYIASTQRDLIAGEVSKDISMRKILPADLAQAHEIGAIYIHK